MRLSSALAEDRVCCLLAATGVTEDDIERLEPRSLENGVRDLASIERFKDKTFRQWQRDQEAVGLDGTWACFNDGGKSRSPWERLRNRGRQRRGRNQRRTAPQRKAQWMTPCECAAIDSDRPHSLRRVPVNVFLNLPITQNRGQSRRK